MKSFSELAKSVTIRMEGREILLNELDESLELIGTGRSAFVFRIKATDLVIKVFFPHFTKIAREEAEIYQILEGVPFYPKLYDYGHNYLVIDYIDGKTLFNCLESGIPITEENIKDIDYALSLAKNRGLNPSDIHLRNILLTPDGSIRMIDVARFRQQHDCKQWRDIKTAFHKLYLHKYFPKKIPSYLLNLLALLYKKKLLPTLSSV